MWLPCCREGPHSAAMKTAQHRYYTAASSSKTSKFERTFNRLGAAVAEENMCKSFRREMCKPRQQASTHIVIDDFRTGDETLRLRCESSCNLWSSMADIRYAMTGSTVDVLASFLVP